MTLLIRGAIIVSRKGVKVMNFNVADLTFEGEKVLYQGRELNDREKMSLVVEAVLNEDENLRVEVCNYLTSFGEAFLKKLWPQLVMALNDFNCVYRYACANYLTTEELRELTEWVATNATELQVKKFAENVPYVDGDLLEEKLNHQKQVVEPEQEKGEVAVDLSEEEIVALREVLIEQESPAAIYHFASEIPQLANQELEQIMIRKCMIAHDLEHLYLYARDVANANIPLLEKGLLAIYNNMPEHEKYLSVKYLYKFDKEIGFSEPEKLGDYILESKNHEYIAYQIADNDERNLLERSFGNYENLYRFSLSCKDFFTEEDCFEEYIEKVKELFSQQKQDNLSRSK